MNDPLELHTRVALVASMVSICVIFLPEIVFGERSSDDNATWHGDIVGFLTGVVISLYLTQVRYVSRKYDPCPRRTTLYSNITYRVDSGIQICP